MAVGYYAILESALRKTKNLKIDSHKEQIGKLYSDFSKIAALNDEGWIANPYDWENISNESDKNPMQALPYNKLHCTSWNVNQASAMILCSEELANELNIPQKNRLYPLASSETNHMIAAIQRPNIIKPTGLQLAADFILNICKEHNIKPNTFEVYSCFPVAVQMFADSLNLDLNSNLTSTGGMPFCRRAIKSFCNSVYC